MYQPYAIRKFILSFSRLQQSVANNQHLQQELQDLRASSQSTFYLPADLRRLLYANIGKVSNDALISIDDLLPLLDNIYDDPIGISVFVKAETTMFPDKFQKVGDDTINKEIRATLLPNAPQALDYRGIFTEDKIPMHIEQGFFSERVAHLWKTQLRRLASMYSDSSTILFPHYNGKKNVSYSTQTLLASFLFDEALLQRVEKAFSGQFKEHSLYTITIDTVPYWYTDVHDVLYPIPFSSGPFGQDAIDEISTIWEGSFDTSDDDMSS
jgi:hypothetical protein